jgi:hypothetical protein
MVAHDSKKSWKIQLCFEKGRKAVKKKKERKTQAKYKEKQTAGVNDGTLKQEMQTKSK